MNSRILKVGLFSTLLTVLTLVFFALCLRGFLDTPTGKYGFLGVKLTPGLTLNKVESIMSRKADYTCVFDPYVIHYWFRPKIMDDNLDITQLPKSVTDKANIPYIYGVPQMLFRDDELMVASTCNGETQLIRTLLGDFQGQHFKQLPDDILEQLNQK